MKTILLLSCVLVLSACGDKPASSKTAGVRTVESTWTDSNGEIWDLKGAGINFQTIRTLPLPDPVQANVRLVGDYFDGRIEIQRLDTLQTLTGSYSVRNDQLVLCLPNLFIEQCQDLN